MAGYARAWSPPTGARGMFAAAEALPRASARPPSPPRTAPRTWACRSRSSRRDLVPFRAAFDAGAPGVVVGHGLYALDDFVTPASLSRRGNRPTSCAAPALQGRRDHRRPGRPPITALGSVPDAAVTRSGGRRHALRLRPAAASSRPRTWRCCARRARRDQPATRLDEAVGRILAVKRDYGADPNRAARSTRRGGRASAGRA